MTGAISPPAPQGVGDHAIYKSLFDAYPDALLVVDQQGRIVMCNPAASALLGYTTEEMSGMTVEALVPDARRDRHATQRAAYFGCPAARPMGTQTDLTAKRKDGVEEMVEIALSPLQEHGQPLVVAAVRGIQAYPRVQQALRRARYSESLARFSRIAADTRDSGALLERISAVAAEALDVPIALVALLEPDGQTLRLIGGVGLLPQERPGALLPVRLDRPSLFGPLLRGEVLVVEDYRSDPRFVAPDSYIQAGIVSGLGVPLFDRGRVIGVLGVRSREARVFGEDECRFLMSLSSILSTGLQRAHTEEVLNHSQRLETVGQLTGGIAHDFNNLLTVIQGNLQMLWEHLLPLGQPAASQMVDAALRASARAAELTAKLLAFSRRQLLEPGALDPGALLHSLADMLRRTLDQHILIEVDVAADCPKVLADPMQLESALLNIAVNARDAMPAGGTLRLSVAPALTLPPAARRQIGDPIASDEDFVHFAIADTGSGMTAEVHARAFEPFFTTKGAGRGTGLGLSTVYGFARQSRGAITIDTAPGVGTTVSLFLPRPSAEEASGRDDSATEHATLPAGIKILLVDDDEEVRRVVQSFLSTQDWSVIGASSGEQALEILRTQGPFDVMVSDIALGAGMRGTAMAAAAQHACPDLAILLMSGFSAELLEGEPEASTGWDFLHKPFGKAELLGAVDRALRRRHPGTLPGATRGRATR